MDPAKSPLDNLVENRMRQYCSVCKQHLDMEVLSESSEDGVVWLKCPQCKGILPKMEDAGGDEASGDTAHEGDGQGDGKVAAEVDDIDVSKARAYEPHESYALGDVVHHRGWDDYGVVTAKETLPGNRKVIRVRFTDHGEMQLIEEKG